MARGPVSGVWQFRVRRLQGRRLLRRAYEVEFTTNDEAQPDWRRVTSRPVTVIDPPLGPGDAWSVVQAADRTPGEWVSFPPRPDEVPNS